MKYDHSTMSRQLDGNAGLDVCTNRVAKYPQKSEEKGRIDKNIKYTMKELFWRYIGEIKWLVFFKWWRLKLEDNFTRVLSKF